MGPHTPVVGSITDFGEETDTMPSKFRRDRNHIFIRLIFCEISAGGVWGVAAAALVAALLIGGRLYFP
ncbi:hypothetical protein METY_1349 [Methylopila sp. Yamaguchi]|nr:hypothetical protein METY_1349 [Methylopila sp. Yamaguchi]